MLNTKQKIKIVDVLLTLVCVVLFFEILFYHSVIVDWFSSLVTKIGVWGWVGIFVIQFLQVLFIPIPATFITLTSMKMFPDQLLILFAVTGTALILGAVVTYLIGVKWGKKAVIWCAGSEEEYNKWLGFLKSKKTNLLYLATVLLPIFPDDILCLMAGSIRMNFWWFLFSNVIGRLIGLATFIFVFKTIGGSLITIILFIILFIISIIYKIILKRRLKNECNCDR